MNPSFVRKKIAQGELVLTAKACYSDPEVVELLASSGVDGIWICLEHKQLAPETVYSLIQACRLGGADAIIRVKPSNYADLIWLLESGARGLMLPRARDLAEVKAMVDMMKFPPLGRRGYDGIHPEANFGRLTPADYMAEANRENFLIVQIEEPEIVPHIDAIAALTGVDVLFVGPADLTLGLGKFGAMNEPAVVSVVAEVAAACARHGKIAAIPCGPGDVAKYRELGYRFFNVFSDFRGVSTGVKQALETART